MMKMDYNADTAYKTLQQSVDNFRKSDRSGAREAPTFTLDGRNGQLSQRKLAEALEFLHRYGFVCLETDVDSLFSSDCKRLLEETKATQPGAHAAYAFLQQRQQKKAANGDSTPMQIQQVLTEEIHDFEPNALAHSQAAWELRCNPLLRQFFAHLYVVDSKAAMSFPSAAAIQEVADQLLPSIESLLWVENSPAPPDEKRKRTNATASTNPPPPPPSAKVATPPCAQQQQYALASPTFYYNVNWMRAPHVISAYHLDAHNSALQAYFAEYMQQMSSVSKRKTDNVSDRELATGRIKERWLQRVRKELVTTARKVILGKRATNKMVQDAAFHSKKNTTAAAEEPETAEDAESMRAMQSSYDAMIAIGSVNHDEPLIVNVVPGFHNYFIHYLQCKRAKWSQLSGDSISVARNEDSFSETVIHANAVPISLRPGSILIVNRNIPRWAVGAEKGTWCLPVSYRWQCDTLPPAVAQELAGNLVDYHSHAALHAARICPMEVAISATYLKSIADGIVYTSLPHLTGATYFARSTKKTAQDLNQQRLRIYQNWFASVPSNEAPLPQHHYRGPTLPAYLHKLLADEVQPLAILDAQIANAATFLEAKETTATAVVAPPPPPPEKSRKTRQARCAVKCKAPLKESLSRKRTRAECALPARLRGKKQMKEKEEEEVEEEEKEEEEEEKEVKEQEDALQCDNFPVNDFWKTDSISLFDEQNNSALLSTPFLTAWNDGSAENLFDKVDDLMSDAELQSFFQ